MYHNMRARARVCAFNWEIIEQEKLTAQTQEITFFPLLHGEYGDKAELEGPNDSVTTAPVCSVLG